MSEKNINIRLENIPNLNGIIKQESCCMDSAIIHMDNHLQSQN